MTASADQQYLDLLKDIKSNGTDKEDRTGTGTRSVFGRQMRFDLTNNSIPLLTTKKVFAKAIIHELIWMLSGDTNIRYLKKHGVSIWDSWVLSDTAEYSELTLEERIASLRLSSSEIDKLKVKLAELPQDNAHAFLDSKAPRKRLVAGELPKIYQHQWRQWEQFKVIDNTSEVSSFTDKGWVVTDKLSSGATLIRREIDQIKQVISQLMDNPDSRRIIVSAWNAGEIEEMALPPCHTLFQFWTRQLTSKERLDLAISKEVGQTDLSALGDHEIHKHLDTIGIPRRALSSQLYMRSNDVALGQPFNIVQYAILTHMVAQVTGMVAEEFIWTGGDVHVYQNQWEGISEQFRRKPMENTARLDLNQSIDSIFDFTYEDIKIINYQSHPVIRFPAAAV